VIIDDLVQSGGTLYECAVALKAHGAKSVSAFVAHAVFPNHCWSDFLYNNKKGIFEKFWITNSQPTVTSKLPENDVFEVLDLTPQILADLDGHA
jgi:phosphoribosylpyrophosphate synthetase